MDIKPWFVAVKVKSGVLRGFMLIYMNWTKEERDTVVKIIENVELEQNQAKRSQEDGVWFFQVNLEVIDINTNADPDIYINLNGHHLQ